MNFFYLGGENSAIEDVEPPVDFWRNMSNYDSGLQVGLVDPVEAAAKQYGRVPPWMQLAVLQRLHWYFTLELREQAATAALSEKFASVFHGKVHDVMQYIDFDVLESMHLNCISSEIKHALMSYKQLSQRPVVSVAEYDEKQGLVKLTYYVKASDTLPTNSFLVDGLPKKVAFAKFRACRFFHLTLMYQHIAWLPIAGARRLQACVGDSLVPIVLGPDACHSEGGSAPVKGILVNDVILWAALQKERRAKPLPINLAGFKARVLRWLARQPMVRRHFASAWVFTDGDSRADDSAMHLYLWVRKHHPEINTWFLLSRSSPDWQRLDADGFRLMPPGLQRKLLVLNSSHYISSHYSSAPGELSPEVYGDLKAWRVTYLQHGVTHANSSHRFNKFDVDLMISTTVAEYQDIAGNGSPYKFTDREVHRLGLPRHDRLLQLARDTLVQDIKVLLIMPTWRATLAKGTMREFAGSDYARYWRGVLNNEVLHDLVERHSLRLMFLPHPGAEQFLAAFEAPAGVEVIKISLLKNQFQPFLARCVGLITDYTSVAFEMALLRKPVFYYQFDRENFFSGSHTYRQGYFSYLDDGFGPVVFDEEQLMLELGKFFARGCKVETSYLSRMELAMPDVDMQSCRKVFERIVKINQPYIDTDD